MESVINTNLEATRFSYNKFNLPDSYRHLIDLEIAEDYSMGYLNTLGLEQGLVRHFCFTI